MARTDLCYETPLLSSLMYRRCKCIKMVKKQQQTLCRVSVDGTHPVVLRSSTWPVPLVSASSTKAFECFTQALWGSNAHTSFIFRNLMKETFLPVWSCKMFKKEWFMNSSSYRLCNFVVFELFFPFKKLEYNHIWRLIIYPSNILILHIGLAKTSSSAVGHDALPHKVLMRSAR